LESPVTLVNKAAPFHWEETHFVKRKDEKLYGEYRTKRVILEVYDEMKRAMEMGEVYRTRLEPGPGDRAVVTSQKRMLP